MSSKDKGVTLETLIVNALRHKPTEIVPGECRVNGEFSSQEDFDRAMKMAMLSCDVVIDHRKIMREVLDVTEEISLKDKRDMFKTLQKIGQYSYLKPEWQKSIKVVIGSVFGDEGKGLMTDYFCRKTPVNADVVNVRFNGSAQAGHTVVTPEGDRHIFSHFGAGSFCHHVTTYLSSFFLVHPIKFLSEYKELQAKGVTPKVLVSRDSLVILPYDAMVNIFIEEVRGVDRHGSCGLGVFEAVVRSEDETFKLNIADLQGEDCILFDKMKKIRDTYYVNRLKELGIVELTENQKLLFYNDNILYKFLEDCKMMLSLVKVVSDNVLNDFEYLIFEGAQGLLLDWGNREYMPNLTASYTGLKNVVALLNKIEDIDTSDIEICYAARSYFTRHGAGRFETEVENQDKLGYPIVEKTNVTNPHQGIFRFGYFDKPLFLRNIEKDLGYLTDLKTDTKPAISMAITHLDETSDKLLLGEDQEEHIEQFKENIEKLGFDTLYAARGETRRTVTRVD